MTIKNTHVFNSFLSNNKEVVLVVLVVFTLFAAKLNHFVLEFLNVVFFEML